MASVSGTPRGHNGALFGAHRASPAPGIYEAPAGGRLGEGQLQRLKGGGQRAALEDPMSLPALCVPPNTGLYNPTPFLSLSTTLSGAEAAQLNQAAGPSPGPECQGHPAVTPSLCTKHSWVPPRVPRSGHWAASSPSQHELRSGPGGCAPSPSVPYSLL